jgi:hypothetical protein
MIVYWSRCQINAKCTLLFRLLWHFRNTEYTELSPVIHKFYLIEKLSFGAGSRLQPVVLTSLSHLLANLMA